MSPVGHPVPVVTPCLRPLGCGDSPCAACEAADANAAADGGYVQRREALWPDRYRGRRPDRLPAGLARIARKYRASPRATHDPCHSVPAKGGSCDE